MKLSYVLIESAIPNNSTRQLWLDHFGPKLKVLFCFPPFLSSLFSFLFKKVLPFIYFLNLQQIGWTTFSNSFFEGFVKAEKALYDEHEIVSSTPLVGAPSDAQISSASQQVCLPLFFFLLFFRPVFFFSCVFFFFVAGSRKMVESDFV